MIRYTCRSLAFWSLTLAPLVFPLGQGAANAAEAVDVSTLTNKMSSFSFSPQAPDDLGKNLGFAAGFGKDESLSLEKSTQSSPQVDHYHFEQLYQGVPVWGERVTVTKNKATSAMHFSGTVQRNLGADVQDTKPTITAENALQRAKDAVRPVGLAASAMKTENENARLVLYVRPSDKKAFLSYEVSFFAITDKQTGKATRPVFLIDAKTGETLFRYENLMRAEARGPGGNSRTGEYYYGRNGLPGLEVEVAGNTCSLETKDVVTINMNEKTDGPDEAFKFPCGENKIKPINGGFSPLNDAHYFANLAVRMYRDWYETAPLKGRVLVRVHFAEGFEGAFWEGAHLHFGDGGSAMYPVVALDVVAHELSHGFTEQHSGLIYAGQSGAMNEAFSDMAGEAAKAYADRSDTANFLIGENIMKVANSSLRYMCDPKKDGGSIDNIKDYKEGLDVHYASGVYNKAFCLLAQTPGWGIRKSFGVFLAANSGYWKPASDFVSGANDVMTAAADLGYNTDDVKAAFNAVGVMIGASPAPQPQAAGSDRVASAKTTTTTALNRPGTLNPAAPTPSSQQPSSTNTATPNTGAPAASHAHEAHAIQPQAAGPTEGGTDAQGKSIYGQWMLPEDADVLTIRENGEWLHPKYGEATMKETHDEAADIKVFYRDSVVRCQYRVAIIDNGKVLTLMPVSNSQDPDYCPSGELKRAP